MLLLQVKLVNIANLSSKNFPPVCQEGIWSRCLLLVKITRSVKGVNLRLTALAIILVVKTSRQSNRGFFFCHGQLLGDWHQVLTGIENGHKNLIPLEVFRASTLSVLGWVKMVI